MTGYVVRLTDRGFGFIREGLQARPGHQEWFFHRSDCVPSTLFNQLAVGSIVSFTPGLEAAKGPRAEAVHVP